ncbi:uncharacterized protein LOC142321403 [Lycorma delicatula]|uniref:uncharacterized protein LOC142321403 n=1 Tax=Lycorma delicatula TaxID=130591 RepID=UPI003F518878
MYEIFIGAWTNSKNLIRKNRVVEPVAIQHTTNILSENEARGFWIRWNGGRIAVGKMGEMDPFLSWDDSEHFRITHFGVHTGWGATGKWVIEVPKCDPGWDLGYTESKGPAKWIAALDGEIPHNAIPAGMVQLYVGRSVYEGDVLPGKVAPYQGVCYVPWNGAEHGIPKYEVLCECDVTWMPAANGEIPSGALPSGETQDGEILYVGRAEHKGVTVLGKVQRSKKLCYITYSGEEIAYSQYEVLVTK